MRRFVVDYLGTNRDVAGVIRTIFDNLVKEDIVTIWNAYEYYPISDLYVKKDAYVLDIISIYNMSNFEASLIYTLKIIDKIKLALASTRKAGLVYYDHDCKLLTFHMDKLRALRGY